MIDPAPRGTVGTVRDWMSRRPVIVSPDLSIGRVIGLMQARGIRHVLVMDGECVAGIVSNRDIRRLLGGAGPSVSLETPVAQIMTEDPVRVSPEALLTEAARGMLDRKIGALPVIEDGRPIGILTKSDVLEALLAWAEGRPVLSLPEELE